MSPAALERSPYSATQATPSAVAELQRTIDAHLDPAMLFAPRMGQARRRHGCIMTLEPVFVLAGLALAQTRVARGDTSADSCSLEQAQVAWLATALKFVRSVSPGEVERETDSDERYHEKLRWFERAMGMFRSERTGCTGGELRDELWDGGWQPWSRVLWGLM